MLNGIDVSHHQRPNDFDWETLPSAIDFGIARATYGITIDGAFRTFVRRFRAGAVVAGAYHFYRQNQPWRPQLEAFERQLDAGGFGPGDMIPAIDLEWNETYDGEVDPNQHNSEGRRLVEAVAEKYGQAMIYLSPAFYVTLGSPEWMLDHVLWAAAWGKQEPWIDRWPWSVWQNSGSGRLSSYAGGRKDIDLDTATRFPLIGAAEVKTIPPAAPLGRRALEWSKLEMGRYHGRPPASRVAEYHRLAVRGGRPLGIRSGNHCASAACFATWQVATPEEIEQLPHLYRASGIEIERDAKANGGWITRDAVLVGTVTPQAGDLVILQRGAPGSWTRHVARLDEWRGRTATYVDANSRGGAWLPVTRSHDLPKILGWVRQSMEEKADAIDTFDLDEVIAQASTANRIDWDAHDQLVLDHNLGMWSEA